ncbi:type II toxin-antitoxin system PemK/MazF family toxin [Acuticoccus sp. MNP-M23]|uniref:type II toxin-antitoxin system PemK/MazF family toxin n=1 Tax=Acuticoccus sp. MNP-M23 TaxID=3072793 RepID=UPI0028155AF4|nr:type II toxin-antitoxin system PemK/MazF family toxin [Acuticoccus sp. MNP-M23]WMS43723.1 type II toxin-antitoxin system PemK/MazF family toxin [Acuticoccus sp. MNP-M23]
MPLKFPPKLGQLLICDFDKGGFLPPEMVKRRPAVVVSPRLRSRTLITTVVPLSTTPPDPPEPFVVELNFDEPLAKRFRATTMWAKCDMIAAVSLARLDLFRVGTDAQTGKRRYSDRTLSPQEFAAVRAGIIAAIGEVR